MSAPLDLRAVSVILEKQTGFDSIPTIERVYLGADDRRYECCFPECDIVRRDAAAMWRHIHFSSRHGLSFGVKTPQEAVAAYVGETP